MSLRAKRGASRNRSPRPGPARNQKSPKAAVSKAPQVQVQAIEELSSTATGSADGNINLTDPYTPASNWAPHLHPGPAYCTVFLSVVYLNAAIFGESFNFFRFLHLGIWGAGFRY